MEPISSVYGTGSFEARQARARRVLAIQNWVLAKQERRIAKKKAAIAELDRLIAPLRRERERCHRLGLC